jgi:hypothetical protein
VRGRNLSLGTNNIPRISDAGDFFAWIVATEEKSKHQQADF